MDKLYIACDYGAETGRVMLGTLHKDKLTMSEVRRFPNQPTQEKDALHWNIPVLYHETLEALREISRYDETVQSISCTSWAGDYLLFDKDGSLIAPASRPSAASTAAGMREVLSRIAAEKIYDETGVQSSPFNTLFQLAVETPKRLKRTSHILPVADGFNYLFSGVPRVETSLAGATQMFNPATDTWSDLLISALKLSPKLLPGVVDSGTKLGSLRPQVAKESGLEDVRVIASCSHQIAAALAGLATPADEHWAFLQPGVTSLMGTEIRGPIISDMSRDLGFNNEMSCGKSVRFSKRTAGLWILSECQRYWQQNDRDLDGDVISHLAIASEPFEALINPDDPRFAEPGDMPLKIQAYCKETGQTIPRKPGPIMRCVLESLALQYRKTLAEIEYLTGREIRRLYLLGGSKTDLLAHFTANAVQIPVTILPPDAAAIGNVMVQAVANNHVQSLDHAREIIRNSFKLDVITPHPAVWSGSYERFAELAAA